MLLATLLSATLLVSGTHAATVANDSGSNGATSRVPFAGDSATAAKSSRKHWWSVSIPDLPLRKLGVRRPGAATAETMRDVSERLRALVSEEEGFYSREARYTKRIGDVRRFRQKRDTTLDAVQVEVIYATTRGWSAVGTHPAAPGKSCVIFVGDRNAFPIMTRTREKALDALREGRPVCDD